MHEWVHDGHFTDKDIVYEGYDGPHITLGEGEQQQQNEFFYSYDFKIRIYDRSLTPCIFRLLLLYIFIYGDLRFLAFATHKIAQPKYFMVESTGEDGETISVGPYRGADLVHWHGAGEILFIERR